MSYKYISNTDRVVSTTNLYESSSRISSSTAFLTNKASSSSPTSNFYATIYSGNVSNKIYDVSFGRSAVTTGDSDSTTGKRKKLVYNEFAKILLGVNTGSVINKFSVATGSDVASSDRILHNAFFITFPRSEFKDKIKAGSFNLVINSNANPTTQYKISLSDLSGAMTSPIKKSCETGEYGVLLVNSRSHNDIIINNQNNAQGLIFYEAGIAVISPYVFSQYNASNANPSDTNTNINSNILGVLVNSAPTTVSGSGSVKSLTTDVNIPNISFGLGQWIQTASYQSTTELNSTIYFCRAFNDEFNYSSNPTYLTSSEILVKGGDPMAQPVSYITTVGLYDDKNQLLAVAKVSEPIKKTPDTELIARVRLDF